jgi:serine/threonine protein kinase
MFGTLTEQFRNEVNMLARIDHLNLVRLIGYVELGDERILVEEFVANHNLREHLDGEIFLHMDAYFITNLH